ncbi:hypothetical protein GQR58_011851 [Nymphon striatum]|nr:hypothetical protein GQR58_011851 [Nymphon striatum]
MTYGRLISVSTPGQVVHTKCRKDFCSQLSIERDNRKRRYDCTGCSSDTVRARRSASSAFHYSEHCLFCGTPDKYKGRQKHKVISVRTMDFQRKVTESCVERNDAWSLCLFQQRKKETSKDLFADLKALAKDCNFKASFDSRSRDQLFMAVDSQVYFKYLLAEDLNLEAMTAVALLERTRTLEAAHIMASQRRNVIDYEIQDILLESVDDDNTLEDGATFSSADEIPSDLESSDGYSRSNDEESDSEVNHCHEHKIKNLEYIIDTLNMAQVKAERTERKNNLIVSGLAAESPENDTLKKICKYSANEKSEISDKKDGKGIRWTYFKARQTFFGETLEDSHTLTALRQAPKDPDQFRKVMRAVISAVVELLERQYRKYFDTELTEKLKEETKSARSHNIDAEEVMGMFSAAKNRAPNATLCFLSSKMRAQKNRTVAYLDTLSVEKREDIVKKATKLGFEHRNKRRLKHKELEVELSRRQAAKQQARETTDRNRLEKRLKTIAPEQLAENFQRKIRRSD